MRSRPVTTTSTVDAGPPPSTSLEVAWSFLQHAPMGVLAVGRDGKILAANPSALRLLGYAGLPVVGEDAA